VPREPEHGAGPATGLDDTDELPVLDLDAYQSRLAAGGDTVSLPAPQDPEAAQDTGRPPRAIAPPPSETLRDIEDWIAAQKVRDRDHEQALAQLCASQAEARARADGLAIELDNVRSALQAALGRANDSERAADASAAAVRAAEARTSELAATHEQTRAELLATAQRLASREAELDNARRAAAARTGAQFETLQSTEWQRTVWEGMWRELDAELAEARTALARLDRERGRTVLAHTVEELRAALAERDATIARLEADATAQATALRDRKDAESEEQRAAKTAALELAARNTALVSDVATLEDARRQLAESLVLRGSELAEARRAREELETALRAAQTANETQAARIRELESGGVDVVQALQAQAAAAQRAIAMLQAADRKGSAQPRRFEDVDAQINVALRPAAARTSAARPEDAAPAGGVTGLATDCGRPEECRETAGGGTPGSEAPGQEPAGSGVPPRQADAARRALEVQLERARAALAHDGERAASLEARQRELTLELERTRGALDERELRIRRLERQAAASAQALGRIKVGIENTTRSPGDGPPATTGASAALIPLSGEAEGIVTLQRRTTIGRAPLNDVCLNDASISRRHAVVLVRPNGAFIEDQGSVNGVAVNGRRIRHSRLAEGDVVTLGLVRFRFTTRAGTSPEAH
jgi:chromosome segregation ATPase